MGLFISQCSLFSDYWCICTTTPTYIKPHRSLFFLSTFLQSLDFNFQSILLQFPFIIAFFTILIAYTQHTQLFLHFPLAFQVLRDGFNHLLYAFRVEIQRIQPVLLYQLLDYVEVLKHSWVLAEVAVLVEVALQVLVEVQAHQAVQQRLLQLLPALLHLQKEGLLTREVLT